MNSMRINICTCTQNIWFYLAAICHIQWIYIWISFEPTTYHNVSFVCQALQLRDGSESIGAVEQWLVAGVRSACDGSCENSRLTGGIGLGATKREIYGYIYMYIYMCVCICMYIYIWINICEIYWHVMEYRELSISINDSSHDMHDSMPAIPSPPFPCFLNTFFHFILLPAIAFYCPSVLTLPHFLVLCNPCQQPSACKLVWYQLQRSMAISGT